jgi:S-adenosylmethionine:tRNA ribosyltransferase-isomerase
MSKNVNSLPSPNSGNETDTSLAAYDYWLPEILIAQAPAVPRDSSRLLVVRAGFEHCIFRQVAQQLQPGDLLVLNNTRVIPARLLGRKAVAHQSANQEVHQDAHQDAIGQDAIGETPAVAVEVFLLEQKGDCLWLALVKPGRRLKPGAKIEFGGESGKPLLRATVVATDAETRGRLIEFELDANQTFESLLAELGELPLPPYIESAHTQPEQYQTVFATTPGAVAAPTAGLHFTPELLQTLQTQGIRQAYVTLHVGIGTFRPVETANITDHAMHPEWVEVSAETVALLEETRARGGRIIAVGTTAVRSLEGIATRFGKLQPYCGKVNLFIYPGYQWKVVDGLITNFHLPRSSLLMLVSALVGRERLMDLYQEAIAQRYRFYSFGDAMLILPEATRASRERA